MNIGDKIKELRKDNNFTLKELSKRTGLSISFISDIENGRRNPRLENLDKISKALNVDISYLLDENKEVSMEDESKNKANLEKLEKDFPEGVYVLRRASKELSPEAKEQMLKIMKTFLEEDDDE